MSFKDKYRKRNVFAGCESRCDDNAEFKAEKQKISWLRPLHKLNYSHLLRTRMFVTEIAKSRIHYPANRVHTRSSFKNRFNIICPFLPGLPGDVFNDGHTSYSYIYIH